LGFWAAPPSNKLRLTPTTPQVGHPRLYGKFSLYIVSLSGSLFYDYIYLY